MRQKKLWGFILSAALVLGSTLTAQANTREHTITIENSRKDHVYEAYQVFSGDWTQEGTGSAKKDILSNVAWGSGVNGDALLAELKTDELLGDAFRLADDSRSAAQGGWIAFGSEEALGAWLAAEKPGSAAELPRKAKFYFVNDGISLCADTKNIVLNVN